MPPHPPSEEIREVVEAEPVDDSENVRSEPDIQAAETVAAEAPIAEVIEIDEQPAPVKARRSRKAPTAGKPTARKPTGARPSSRRKKVPASAA